MKQIGILFLLSVCTVLPGVAQEAFHQAFQQGNADQLAKYLPAELELCIINREQTVSKSKALQDLRNFFSTHKVTQYNSKHSGGSQDQGKSYTIGNLVTDKGEFRVYVYYRKNGASLEILEIRIEN